MNLSFNLLTAIQEIEHEKRIRLYRNNTYSTIFDDSLNSSQVSNLKKKNVIVCVANIPIIFSVVNKLQKICRPENCSISINPNTNPSKSASKIHKANPFNFDYQRRKHTITDIILFNPKHTITIIKQVRSDQLIYKYAKQIIKIALTLQSISKIKIPLLNSPSKKESIIISLNFP
ncbi:hypothetical protein ABPG72_010503 [Tetrahymena utriculariae]